MTWCSDKFQNLIDKAMVYCYEDKIITRKHNGIKKLTKSTLKLARSVGSYIPCDSRVSIVNADGVYNPDTGEPNFGYFDIENDRPPKAASFIVDPNDSERSFFGNPYMVGIYLIKCNPKEIRAFQMSPPFPGISYKLIHLSVLNKGGVFGGVEYINVGRDGKVGMFDLTGPLTRAAHEPKYMGEINFISGITLQSEADRRFCWSITAEDCKGKITISCEKEEVKSLLYARSQPLSRSGRLRPVLHLVSSHNKRIKEGIEINIDNYLRGLRKVTIENTRFTVSPPEAGIAYPQEKDD